MLIVGNRARDLAVAALHKNVGQRLAERRGALDMRQQMRLALGFGNEQRSGSASLACFRTGPATVMSSFLASVLTTPAGALATRRDTPRELGQRLGLDLLDQAADDVVEQRNMFGVEAGAPSRNKVVMRRRVSARFSAEPCWTTSSNSGSSEAGTLIRNLQNAVKSDRLPAVYPNLRADF